MGHKAAVELVLDCRQPAKLAGFWRAALDYRPLFLDANLAVLIPKQGSGAPLLLQAVLGQDVGPEQNEFCVSTGVEWQQPAKVTKKLLDRSKTVGQLWDRDPARSEHGLHVLEKTHRRWR